MSAISSSALGLGGEIRLPYFGALRRGSLTEVRSTMFYVERLKIGPGRAVFAVSPDRFTAKWLI
jgi:hypothetical protein